MASRPAGDSVIAAAAAFFSMHLCRLVPGMVTNVRSPRQQPGQRQLRRRAAFGFRQGGKAPDHLQVAGKIFSAETRDLFAKARRYQPGIGLQLAAKNAAGQRAEDAKQGGLFRLTPKG